MAEFKGSRICPICGRNFKLNKTTKKVYCTHCDYIEHATWDDLISSACYNVDDCVHTDGCDGANDCCRVFARQYANTSEKLAQALCHVMKQLIDISECDVAKCNTDACLAKTTCSVASASIVLNEYQSRKNLGDG